MKSLNEIIMVGHVRAGGTGSDYVHQVDLVYAESGVCPTMRSSQYKDPPRVLLRRKQNVK